MDVKATKMSSTFTPIAAKNRERRMASMRVAIGHACGSIARATSSAAATRRNIGAVNLMPKAAAAMRRTAAARPKVIRCPNFQTANANANEAQAIGIVIYKRRMRQEIRIHGKGDARANSRDRPGQFPRPARNQNPQHHPKRQHHPARSLHKRIPIIARCLPESLLTPIESNVLLAWRVEPGVGAEIRVNCIAAIESRSPIGPRGEVFRIEPKIAVVEPLSNLPAHDAARHTSGFWWCRREITQERGKPEDRPAGDHSGMDGF